jgi:hypothetical protein
MSPHSKVLSQYQEFCASPLRTREEITAEFEELCRNPAVTHLAFHKPHILMIGTKPLIISWEDLKFEIGELIIFFIRKRVGRVWETGFFVANPTGALPSADEENYKKGCFIHPHITLCNHEDINFPVGELCISAGQFVIYQSLRKGLINMAFSHLWTALHVYGTGQPFCPVEFWPSFVEESNND